MLNIVSHSPGRGGIANMLVLVLESLSCSVVDRGMNVLTAVGREVRFR